MAESKYQCAPSAVSTRQRIVLAVLTDQREGAGSYGVLEDAIGRVAQQIAEYYEY